MSCKGPPSASHVLVCCISSPFILPFEIHGWSGCTVEVIFLLVLNCVLSFKWDLFNKLKRVDGLPLSCKFKPVATRAASLCRILPSCPKVKPCPETELTYSSPCHKAGVAQAVRVYPEPIKKGEKKKSNKICCKWFFKSLQKPQMNDLWQQTGWMYRDFRCHCTWLFIYILIRTLI